MNKFETWRARRAKFFLFAWKFMCLKQRANFDQPFASLFYVFWTIRQNHLTKPAAPQQSPSELPFAPASITYSYAWKYSLKTS